MTFNPIFVKTALYATAVCGLLFAVSVLCRPLFPVDETRYVTVAWEMFSSGNWILPTLNGEAYHHKPPVLFWMIMSLWSVFGVSQTVPMVIPYLAGFAVLLLTARLATRLFPHNPKAPFVAALLLGGSLPFVVYTNLIMFDTLLTVSSLIGITALWDFLTTRHNKHLLLLVLAIGFGALIKGPVILLQVLPVALFAPFWLPNGERPPLAPTILKILAAILLGAGIGLLWAIPAAMEGGKEFADKIFWGQTAGRVVNAFDHKHPFYWYMTFIPLFFLPWAFAPAFWRGVKEVVRERVQPIKFIITWAVPVFIAFSAISGKQVHYLLPLAPAIALFTTAIFLKTGETLEKWDVRALAIGGTFLTLFPHLVHLVTEIFEESYAESAHLDNMFEDTNPYFSIISAIMMLLAMVIWSRRDKIKTIIVMAVFTVLMMCSFELSVRNSYFKYYDLTPIAEAIKPLESRPMAFAGNYAGEFGFLARRTRPIEEIKREEARSWLDSHPNGVVVLFDRVKNAENYQKYHTIAQMPFRMTNIYMVLENKGVGEPTNQPSAGGDNSTPPPHVAPQ
ncbi:MAG: glycosyltransferase family 39 protein [Pseudobdellovibrionaceae bacterium]